MKERIQETLNGLKDFQLKTVDYVFHQLYKEKRNKMLIADEVGLGKTIVAKGLIAKAFGRFKPDRKKPTFNVIYICSNQALAKQNLSKLNFTGNPEAIDYSEEDDRLTGLAYVSEKEDHELHFRIKAFTPATSFDDKTHAGKADERILLYRLLYTYKALAEEKNSLKWILKGTRIMWDENWEKLIKKAEDFDKGKPANLRKIRHKVFEKFRKELKETVSPDELKKSFAAAGINHPVKLWTLLKRLCNLGIRKNNYRSYDFSRELISMLRFRLSTVCLEYLQADIFILDEFQRYKELIQKQSSDGDDEKISPAIELAREIFSLKNAKILMLSATPFKPFTNEFDELQGEVHYNEFKNLLQFLMTEKDPAFWEQYEKDRKTFFSYLRHPDKLTGEMKEPLDLKKKLESLYRSSLVRTEKLLVSEHRDAMIKHITDKPITIQPDDIHDFVVFDQITQVLNEKHDASLSTPLEYVKSSPYALSFLDHYQHKEKIRALVSEDPTLRKLLRKTRHAWVNLDDIDEYKPLIPARGKALPNAKLRLLLEETVLNNGWKLLWIPPCIPYYEPAGAFKDSTGYSKTLIFSSWKLVPRMVSSLVSYEAERLSIGNRKSVSVREVDEKHVYFQRKRSPRPQFTFKVDSASQEPSQMNAFMLTYPSMFLARYYDPADNVIEKKSLAEILAHLRTQLMADFRRLDLNQYVTGTGDWQKWYWMAPLLFGKASKLHEVAEWFINGEVNRELTDIEESDEDELEAASGKIKHFATAKECFLNEGQVSGATLNDEQIGIICGHLAMMVIASPAVCFVRSQLRHHPFSTEILDAAYDVGSSFLTMLNKPESIAIVRLHTEETDYWQRVLTYLVDGNVQAMLDEYVFLLSKGENIQSPTELGAFVSDVLSIRTATSDTDDLKGFMENLQRDRKRRRSMRSHYAVDFGTQKVSTAKGAGRMINIRQAFNSPFRPFVLASTSIGQEGLDFHLYCKKIFHWNLPANPIDFEQREGRIHRYQGLVIRLNLADKYKEEITFTNDKHDVWHEIFRIACDEKKDARFPCDLVPFWHTESKSDIKIERYVPLYPFSRDIEKYNNMIKILAFYRLTFGQPRQEELIDALHEYGFKDEEIKRLDELIINLTPIRFYGNE